MIKWAKKNGYKGTDSFLLEIARKEMKPKDFSNKVKKGIYKKHGASLSKENTEKVTLCSGSA